MKKIDELHLLEIIDGNLRFQIDLKKLSDASLEYMADNLLQGNTNSLLPDCIIENIATESGFDLEQFKRYYRQSKTLKIKSCNRTRITDEELNRSIQNYYESKR